MTRGEYVNGEHDTHELSAAKSALSKGGPASSQVKVELAGATHPGHVRDNNEDHYLALRFQRSLETLCTNLQESTLDRSFDEVGYGLLVADGIGGMAAGEVASQMALRKLVELVVNTPDWIMKFNQPENENTVMQRITQRFRQVDDALKDQAQQESSVMGMGTTLTVALSLGNTLLIGHIGDSRAYVMRGNTLHQLTNDHTMAQALVDAGIASPGDATTRALHHVLTAALGTSSERADPQVLSFRLSHNDQVLLCTDGLTEMVSAEAIACVLSEASSSRFACDFLIDLALSAGGVDNVTVVVARYQFPDVVSLI
jgi:PPM family protein phosphatase